MSSMSDRDRKILLAIVPLVVIVAYWFLLFSPKREEAASAKKEATEQQQRLKSARALAAQANGSKTNFAADYGEIVRLGKAIPARVDMPSLLVQLDRAAEGTGITFTKIAQGERTAPVVAAPVASVTPPADQSGGTTPATPAAPGTPATPVAAGGAPAQSAPGAATEAANGAAATSDQANAAADAVRRDPADAQTSTSSRRWPPRGRRSRHGGHRRARDTVTSGGLETVPLELEFVGNFFNLADFFHDVKRFVHVANNSVVVNGRLVTIEGINFSERHHHLPAHQGGADGDGLPLAAGPGRDRRSDPRGSRHSDRPRPPRRRAPPPTERLPPRTPAPTAAATP